MVVELVVARSKARLEKRGIIFLDSAEDFTSKENLGIAISARAALDFKRSGIEDPAAYFLKKRIRVTGCIMQFADRPYLPVLDAKQIEVVANQ